MQKDAKRGGRMVRGFRSGCMEPAPGAACEKQDEAAALRRRRSEPSVIRRLMRVVPPRSELSVPLEGQAVFLMERRLLWQRTRNW